MFIDRSSLYPSYCIDAFTRPGRLCLMALWRSSSPLQNVVRHRAFSVPLAQTLGALLFDVEGGICTVESLNETGSELKNLSIALHSRMALLLCES
jgi:hypothetical protein